VNNGGEYITELLCDFYVKYKLFESVKKPQELMHEPNRNNYSRSTDLHTLQITSAHAVFPVCYVFTSRCLITAPTM
jgi:hypothetical protein